MGIWSYLSQISTTVSSSIRETSDARQSTRRAPRARRQIARAVSETLEGRTLFAAGPTPGSFTATPTSITTASASPEVVSITYTDMTTPVLASSIASGNITVSGGPATVGTITASAVPSMNASSIVAGYSIAAPTGGWTAADDGTYTVALNATVTDTSLNAVTANPTFGTFTVNIPGAGPTAGSFTATPPTITTASASPEVISITYTDMTTPVLASSIASGNITVSGGPATVGTITASAVPSMNASSIVAGYSIAAPTGGWTAADNGTYTVALNATVTDTSAHAVTANPSFGMFTVNIPAPGPVATLTAPTNINTAGGTTKSIVVTYSDTASPIDVTSIGIGNITVTGPGSTALTVLSATPSPATNGSPITVTYVVQSPGGTPWSVADTGTYTIGLTATVKDVAGTFVTANPSFGSFSVAIVNPPTAAFTPPATIVASQQVFTFTVVYSDATNPVKVSTIGVGNVTVTGPTGALTVLTATPTPNANANSISVVYTVSAPTALGFGPGDNGTYTVALTGTVTDTSGNAVVAVPSFGTFVVTIIDADAPLPTLIQNLDITSTGQFSKQVIIDFTDSIGVDPTTITTSNISVISSTGQTLVVTSAVADSAVPKPTIQATYTIEKADGTVFTASDNGTYTVSINAPPLSPANVSGVHAAALALIGTFVVNVPDRIAPVGVITAPDVTATGVTQEVITVVLTDNNAINVATIKAGNLVVISPSGKQLPVVQIIGLPQPNGPTITVQFVIDAPNGTFTTSDNGEYTVTLTGVTDVAGNFMTEAVGSFDVDVPAPFERNFSLGTFTSVKGKGQSNKLKFRDTPDGTVGIITIKNGTGEVTQEATTNSIDLTLNDIGKGVDVSLTTNNGRPITINDIFVHGTLVNFNAPMANVTGTFYVAGTAQKATFFHLVGTPEVPAVFAAAGPIQKLIIAKATTQAMILSGANLGSTGLLGQPDDVFGGGEIDSLTLGGQFTTTIVEAGAAPGPDGEFGTGDDTSAGTNSIIHSVVADNGTGQGVLFEANGFGIFKFNKKKFTPNPATDPRFKLLP